MGCTTICVNNGLSFVSTGVYQTVFQTFYLDAKNRNALAVSAGFKIFIPVPQKLLLPIITANIVATASIHKGTSMGIISGINMPETKSLH
jgi:hypothetical protein